MRLALYYWKGSASNLDCGAVLKRAKQIVSQSFEVLQGLLLGDRALGEQSQEWLGVRQICRWMLCFSFFGLII